jgi:hypothetical protein
MVSLDEVVAFCDKALRDRRWLFFPVLSFFAFVCSGYFIRCLVWGFYPLGSDILTTVALSSFVSVPLLFFSVILYNDAHTIGFIDENKRSPTFEENGRYFPIVVISALAACSMVEWLIIAVIFFEKYVLASLFGSPITRLLTASVLFIVAVLTLVVLLYQKERERKNLEEVLSLQQRGENANPSTGAAQFSLEVEIPHSNS